VVHLPDSIFTGFGSVHFVFGKAITTRIDDEITALAKKTIITTKKVSAAQLNYNIL